MLKKLFPLAVMFLVLASSALAGTPHAILGFVQDADDGVESFNAEISCYIDGRPNEVLKTNVDNDKSWIVDIGNFETQWEIGDELVIDIKKGSYFDKAVLVLNSEGAQQAPDMKLKRDFTIFYIIAAIIVVIIAIITVLLVAKKKRTKKRRKR